MIEYKLLSYLLISVFLSIASSSLGVLSLWQRNAYFSDALAHGSILGITIALMMGISPFYGLFCFAIIFASMILILRSNDYFSNDTILAILSYGSLSIGLVITSIIRKTDDVDLESFLSGNLEDITMSDILTMMFVSIVIFIIVKIIWKKIILITINKDLATSLGIKSYKYDLIFIMMLAIFVSLAIKMIGVLMVAALMIIPSASARLFSRTPTSMLNLSLIFSLFATLIGVMLAYYFQLKISATIVMTSFILFIISKLFIKTLD